MTGEPRILVVDDEVLAAMAIEEFLSSRGFRVTLAADGVEALERIDGCGGDGYAAVITDLRMPRMDGRRLIHELRARHPSLPVIVMTGYLSAEAEDDDILRQPVPIPVLSKPVSPHALDEALRGILAMR
jgi:CheY-like chemotaxis protein